MNIQITSRKFRAKETLKDFIKSEVTALEKYNSEILDAEVVLSFMHEKDSIKTAEVILQVPGRILKASQSSEEFEKSITGASSKLVRQLKQLKSKKIAAKR
ncbi:MAG: ribosome-associated translation inhibitor RaiA [Bacteroidetes bacterium]|nr:ribosome-associated translation inhibitor RaiA [Bacteroidota bacterium]MBU1678398.1 ribosome-associated translation inhibitor RaiA [Bacteroidota bacterium]MBU2508492.1 ribosome-associated translation inhibitor RaiA [Bacteroidota bacterium]